MENVIEGNRIIAAFDGYVYHADAILNKQKGVFTKEGKMPMLLKEFKYHTSFDWLMPVCKKFDTLKDDFKDRILYELFCDEIDNAVTCYEIMPVFEKIVTAIKWYNLQNTTPQTVDRIQGDCKM
jgi:uncharacterized UPF0160 family protein